MSDIKRPVLKIPYSRLDKVLEVIAISSITIMFVSLFLIWSNIPDRIPTHFGFSGKPDNWGDRSSLLILPIATAALYLLMTLISIFPHSYNYVVEITQENVHFQYRNARRLIIVLKTEIIILFGFIQWTMINVARGKATGLGGAFLPIFLGVLFGTVGFFIYRMVKNK